MMAVPLGVVWIVIVSPPIVIVSPAMVSCFPTMVGFAVHVCSINDMMQRRLTDLSVRAVVRWNSGRFRTGLSFTAGGAVSSAGRKEVLLVSSSMVPNVLAGAVWHIVGISGMT